MERQHCLIIYLEVFKKTDLCKIILEIIVKEVKKSSAANIYRYIDRPLFDPIENDMKAGLRMFYKTTFWNNGNALKH